MTLELHFVTFICIVFSHCHVTILNEETSSLLCHCHVTCPYVEPLSFFSRSVQKKVSCFSDSFNPKTTQQSDGSCDTTNDSHFLRKVFKKERFHLCKNTEKEFL